MEALAILFFVVIVFLILSLKSSLTARIGSLELEIRRLREKTDKAAKEEVPERVVPAPVATPPKEPIVKDDKWESGFKVMEEIPPIIVPDNPLPQQPAIENSAMADVPRVAAFSNAPAMEKPVFETKQVQQKPGFFGRHPDLEKFIGENLISKIGIAILVLAIGYFVKYAMDNNWIAPVGRVAIGILCGGILAGIGHRLRNNYTAFSSVMVGGALAVFYFTITLAYHQFHLFSQTVSFIIMIVITLFAVLLSLLYKRQELAIIALIGGFATPFMVSNGSGNYQALFTYLIILNTGLLVISYNKAWRLLNLLAFLFTIILFVSWIFSIPGNAAAVTYRNGFTFATIFYLLFFVINIAHNIKQQKKFIASDFGILLANTCLYFSAGLYFITMMNFAEYRGLFSLCLGIFNLGASWLLFRNQKTDKNILYLLIGLTLTFISLTAPIQLHGNHITIFWASETVLLYWLFQKSKITIIRIASFIVWAAMLISLLLDWVTVYGDSNTLPILANKGFITTLFCAASNYILFLLRRKDSAGEATIISKLYPGKYVFRIFSIVLLFMAGAFEIYYQFTTRFAGADLHVLYLLLYIFAFTLALLAITNRVKSLQLTKLFQIVLLSLCLVIYLFFTGQYFYIQEKILNQPSLTIHFAAHWMAALLMAVIIWQLIKIVRDKEGVPIKNIQIATWLLCSAIVIYLSVETHLLVNTLFFNALNPLNNIQRIFVKTGLPILWGLCSFAFMWLGMKYKSRLLRIISLTLFSLTLLKLFIFDIRNIPAAGKIGAFFCLGILLLVVSFMYQRLKKIIIEDEQNHGH